MKKLLFAIAIIAGPLCPAKAEDLYVSFGKLSLHLPVASGVDAGFGYDLRGKKSQGLAETPIAKISIDEGSDVVFKVGGITSEDGKGAPFVGVDYELKGLKNPVPGIADIHPGVYGGRDFHTNEWFYGVKASVDVF